jgi:hypothetical protein
MRKEFDTFIKSVQDLPDGQECQLVIRDLTPGPRKYESRYVRAIVSSSPERLPNADTLWLRFPMGNLHPQPLAIKVVEELGEFMME